MSVKPLKFSQVAVLSLFLLCSIGRAQPFQHSVNPFPVYAGTDTVDNPFSGGIDRPAHQFVDIDLDGDYDLMILDRDNRLTLYRNNGSPSVPRFILESIGYQGLDVGSWFRFVDIDNDGDPDLFANGPSGTVSFFRNTGSGVSPSFAKEAESVVDSGGVPLLSEEISHPEFADPDGDGDLDFFSGNSAGTIWYYENIGTPASFAFRFVTDKYQSIEIIGMGGSTRDPEPARMEEAGPGRVHRHGAMALSFGDLDGDGDQDLIWGDFFNQSLYYLRNDGIPTAPFYVIADSTFPNETPVRTDGFNMPGLVDLDADGDLDLVVGTLSSSSSRNGLLLYRNLGNSAVHNFQLETTMLLPSVDGGAGSVPLVVDLDGDGDRDLLTGAEDGTLTLYHRQGNAFVLAPPPSVPISGLFNISPAAADLDGDGNAELILGDFNGKLRLFLQTDSGFVQTPFSLDSESFGLNAAPALVDIDGDGFIDLFVGTGAGQLSYYRNMGTAQQPDFILQSSGFLSIDVGDDARPAFTDLDGDGDFDLTLGAQDGSLHYYRNDGSASSPLFQHVPGFFDEITVVLRSAPAFDDTDSDGDQDVFVGNGKGGIYYYDNQALPVSAGVITAPMTLRLSQAYPNPFNGIVNFGLSISDWANVQVKVYDILGKETAILVDERKGPGLYTVQWGSGDAPSGVYFIRLQSQGFTETKKMMLLR